MELGGSPDAHLSRRQFITGFFGGRSGLLTDRSPTYALGSAGATSDWSVHWRVRGAAPQTSSSASSRSLAVVGHRFDRTAIGDHYEITQQVRSPPMILPGLSTDDLPDMTASSPADKLSRYSSVAGQSRSTQVQPSVPVSPLVVHLHGGRRHARSMTATPSTSCCRSTVEVPLQAPKLCTMSGDLSKAPERVHWYPLEQPATTHVVSTTHRYGFHGVLGSGPGSGRVSHHSRRSKRTRSASCSVTKQRTPSS